MNDDLRARLDDWLDRLYAWNEHKNLTRVPRDQAWTRHIEDSLTVARFCADGGTVIDLGCGPGLPSYPLALFRPDLKVIAVDSNGKMLDFLRSTPLPNLVVVQGRAEELDLGKADLVTGRAFAPLAIQLEASAAHLRRSGFVVPMRTVADRDLIPRIDLRPLGLEYRGGETIDVGGVERFLPVFVKTSGLSRGYPRHWSIIRQSPLGPVGPDAPPIPESPVHE